MHLTPEQQRVVEHDQGHAKVIAVAGAGKTTTLGHFVKARLDAGQNPRRLLVIMYNKSAQLDFAAKLKRLGSVLAVPQVRTFHSLGLKIYQSLISEGILPAIQGDLISQGESDAVLWRLMQQLAPSDLSKDILEQKKKWIEPMTAYMDRVKSCLEPASLVYEEMDLPSQCKFFPDVFEAFEQWRKRSGRISFNDMLFDPAMLFSKRPDVAARYANHMDWILVDEYQDINAIQQFLLQTLAGHRSQVMVIGDPDQTIYEFRGSRPEYMLNVFDEEFSPATVYTLSETFRYGHQVSLLSNQLIQANQGRPDVLCLSHASNPKTRVVQHVHEDYGQQTLAIVQHALTQFPAHQIAILNRLWGISAPVELALLEADIPYQLDHSSTVLDRMELQPFLLLFEMASGVFAARSPRAKVQAWQTILTLPYLKVKRSVLEDVAHYMSRVDGQFMEHFKKMRHEGINVWQSQQIEARIEITQLAEQNRIRAHQLINRHVRESDFFKGLSDSAFSRQQVDDRIATVQAFSRFLARLNLMPADAYEHIQLLKARRSEQVNRQRDQKDQAAQCIVISSIHKAKGLEWPVVIIPGLTDHNYPYLPENEFSQSSTEDGERRLLYVAMTRAQRELHLIVPPTGEEQGIHADISEFVSQMAVEDLLQLSERIENGGGVCAVPRRAAHTAQQYVRALNAGVSIELKAIQRPIIKKTSTSKQARQSARHQDMASEPVSSQPIRHGKFGLGELRKEDARYFHIYFEDGQLRVLDKSIAAAAIEWL